MTKQTEQEACEDPKRLQADLEHLKDWLAKQPHISSRTDDAFLLLFLRGSKYSLERAKEKLDFFHTMRTALPEFFAARDVMEPRIQALSTAAIVLPLERDALGRRVIFSRVSAYDPKISATVFAKMHIMLAEVILEEEAERVGHGHVVVMDVAGFNLAHLAQFTPALCRKVISVYQDGFPVRPKGVHYLNAAPIIENLISLIRTLLKEKLRNRVFVHSNIESLYKVVPREILPTEYGGSAGTAQEISEKWRQKMVAKRDYFLDDEKHKVDESKRPGKPKTHEDLFGFEGSFRQLSVD